MKPTHIAIVAGGELELGERVLPRIQSYPYLVAVDGGLNHCQRLGLKPDLIIGDLDSADPAALEANQEIPKIVLSPDKDKSDLEETIIHVLNEECQEITLFGAAGNRLDHTLANFLLLSNYAGVLYLETEEELLFCIKQREELDSFPGQRISLIPLNGSVMGVSTTGLKWELINDTLDQRYISLSNEALGESVVIVVEKGDLLCAVQIHK